MPRGGYDYSLITVKGLIQGFRENFDTVLGGSWAPRVAFVNSETNQETENYRWLGGVPEMRRWKGGRDSEGFSIFKISLTNELYEVTTKVDDDDLRRDKLAEIQRKITTTSTVAAEHFEVLSTSLLITNPAAYDNLSFFNAAHVYQLPGGAGTITINNNVTSALIPELNVASPTSPTREEMVNVIMKLVEHMYTFRDDKGRPANGGARRFAIMVPINMWGNTAAAVRDRLTGVVVTGTGVGSGDNKGMNQDWSVEVIPNPRLVASGGLNTELYCFRLDGQEALILQDEVPVTVQAKDDRFDNNAWMFGVKALRAAGVGQFRSAVKATLS